MYLNVYSVDTRSVHAHRAAYQRHLAAAFMLGRSPPALYKQRRLRGPEILRFGGRRLHYSTSCHSKRFVGFLAQTSVGQKVFDGGSATRGFPACVDYRYAKGFSRSFPASGGTASGGSKMHSYAGFARRLYDTSRAAARI